MGATRSSRVMIQQGMMGAGDARDKFAFTSELSAVHADVAHAGFRIFRNEWSRNANSSAKAGFLDRCGQTRDAELLQFGAGIDFLLNRSSIYGRRIDRLGERFAPFLVN